MINWVGVGIGFLSSLFIYALFSEDEEEILEEANTDNSEIEINDFNGRHVTLSCQTCRKLKKHREVEPNLYQCTKCKRHVDLRTR